MEVTPTHIPAVKIIRTKRFEDPRGFFSETYNRQVFAEAGISQEFVQDNHSLSKPQGTVRGLHFQISPFTQDKLVRVLRGSIQDVAVDLRKGSPTFGQHVSAVISAAGLEQILVPVGFAHGFCTLEPNTEVLYKVTNFYSAECDKGIFWNDADLGIEWKIPAGKAILSEKDRHLPRLADLSEQFLFSL